MNCGEAELKRLISCRRENTLRSALSTLHLTKISSNFIDSPYLKMKPTDTPSLTAWGVGVFYGRVQIASVSALLRFPKLLFGLGRRAILTAAPSSPRFIRHRRHFGDDAPYLKKPTKTHRH